jgi:hypothetical protein
LCDYKVRFPSHEVLLQLLHKLLRLIPSLATADVLSYLRTVGVDVDSLMAMRRSGSNNDQHTAVSSIKSAHDVSIFNSPNSPIVRIEGSILHRGDSTEFSRSDSYSRSSSFVDNQNDNVPNSDQQEGNNNQSPTIDSSNDIYSADTAATLD